MVPPIFTRHENWRLVSIETYPAETHLRFETRIAQHRINAIIIVVSRGEPLYIYNALDPATSTIAVYHGPHGDPALDEIGAVAGIEL